MRLRPGGGGEKKGSINLPVFVVPPPLKAKSKLLPSAQANHNNEKEKCEMRCQAGWGWGGWQEVMDGYPEPLIRQTPPMENR